MKRSRPHPFAWSLLALSLAASLSSCARTAAPLSTTMRLNTQQVPDASFGQGGVVTTDLHGQGSEEAEKVALMADGRIVVAAIVDNRTAVARYLADGTPDTTFGTGGQAVLDLGYSLGLGVLPDGRIVLAGNTQFTAAQDVQVIRLRADGQLDPTFGTGGVSTTDLGGIDTAFDLALQPDGRVVVAARAYGFPTSSFFAVRYSESGQLDTSFGQNGVVETPLHRSAQSERVRIDALGRIVLAGGDMIDTGLVERGYAVVARYLPSGALDATFGQGGVSSTYLWQGASIHALDLQPDGRIVLGGTGFSGFTVVRLDAQGTPDWTFGGGDGVADAGPDFGGGGAAGLVVRRNGKILVAGTTARAFTSSTLQDSWGLAQFNPDGTLDLGFGDHGLLDVAYAPGPARDIALQPDGRALVVGALDPTMCSPEYSTCSGTTDLGLARFTPTDGDAPTPPHSVPILPPLDAPLTVTTATQVIATQGDAVTVPVGSAPIIETTLGSAVPAQQAAGRLGALTIPTGQPLTGAEVYVDGVGWQPMVAVDGAFDSPTETVRATLAALTQTGTHTMCVRAVSGRDRSRAGCVPLTVGDVLTFGGFRQPVVGLPTVNTLKAGAAVPVKFSLGGNFGLNVLAGGSPRSAPAACDAAAPIDPVEQTVTAGSSGLQYDVASGLYTYVWKTDRAWAGTCRQFTLTFRDGSAANARFKFSK